LCINVYQDGFFHRPVFEHFFQHATIAATDQQHLGWMRMRQKRNVRHHLRVNEFIAFGELHHVIQDQHGSIKLIPK